MIDRYDAQEGYVAVREQDRYACTGCSLYTGRFECDMKCNAGDREDNTDVIFVTRADFEKMLMQEIEQFYGKGKVKKIVFTEE